jgi:xanthine dehydrogenase YagS FAD-binding subunit
VALSLKFNGDRVERARVILSGAAPIPWRSKEAEQALTGNPLSPDTIKKTVDAALKNSEPLEKNAYKIHVFRGILLEELRAIAKG